MKGHPGNLKSFIPVCFSGFHITTHDFFPASRVKINPVRL
jgi:hypothetical protein